MARGKKLARKPRGKDDVVAPVEVTTVHPEVWQTALDLAGGDGSRIRIVSTTEVVVR